MKVEILDFIKDERGGMVQGKADLKIIYSVDKWEIIRNLTYLKKPDGKAWLNFPSCKREETWLPILERPIEISKAILSEALDALKQYLINLEPSALAENDSEPRTDMF